MNDASSSTSAKKPGCTTGFGLGCLIDIGIIILCFIAFSEQMMISSLAYLVVLTIPALVVRYILHRNGSLNSLIGMLIGPVALLAAVALAIMHPLTIETEDGEEEIATPASVAQSLAPKIADAVPGARQDASATNAVRPHWEGEIPPGVKYVAADTNETASLETALAELNELIGLAEVKKEVEKFAKFVAVSKQRESAGLKVAPISYHMVFTGNPGTGKTTVARIMAKIYRALGIVKNGHLVETDRGGLIAEYVGQTAVKTGKVIDFALDGVLFIDEAYAITEGDGSQGYGGECIATLLKRMEDERDRLVVIVAGYTDEMKRFIDANPGLQSRFNHYVHFPDYTGEELAAIFRMNARKSEYILSADVERWLDAAISVWTKDRDRKFGNGRYIRNLFEESVMRQAIRVSEIENPTKEQLMTLEMRDIGIKLKDPDASKED